MGVWSSIRRATRSAALLVAPTLLLCTAALELGLRAMGRTPTSNTDGIFELGGHAYRLIPNLTRVSTTRSYRCTIHTDSHGYRYRAPGPRTLGPGPYFAFLGDSATFGNGVEYDQSYVGVFAALARERGADAVNLAVGGHNLADQEELLDDLLATAPSRPARVVIVFNDPFLAMFDEPHSGWIVKDGYLFPRDAWVVPYVAVRLGNASAAYSFLRDGIRNTQQKLFPSLPKDALGMLSIFAADYPTARPEGAARLERRLGQVDAKIRAAGAEPVYVYLPTQVDLRWKELTAAAGVSLDGYDVQRYRSMLRRHCQRSGVRLLDLSALLEREHRKGVPLSFRHDMHYTAATSELIGKALFEGLLGGEAVDTGAR